MWLKINVIPVLKSTYHAIYMHWRMVARLHGFFSFIVVGVEVTCTFSRPSPSGKEGRPTHMTGSLVNSNTSLDNVTIRKCTYPCWESNPNLAIYGYTRLPGRRGSVSVTGKFEHLQCHLLCEGWTMSWISGSCKFKMVLPSTQALTAQPIRLYLLRSTGGMCHTLAALRCAFFLFSYSDLCLSTPCNVETCYCNWSTLITLTHSRQDSTTRGNLLVAETSTWQRTTLPTDRHPYFQRDSNPQFQQTSGRTPTPQNTPPLGLAIMAVLNKISLTISYFVFSCVRVCA
jgi:hypothetical protein